MLEILTKTFFVRHNIDNYNLNLLKLVTKLALKQKVQRVQCIVYTSIKITIKQNNNNCSSLS